MKLLGLDIGTTTISAVVIDGGATLAVATVKNDAFLASDAPWARMQDVGAIRDTALSLLAQLLEQHPDVQGIGLTGQMHGIVYLDADGRPVSPLYTWQDGCGDLPFDASESYAQALSRITGYPLATGYGMVTHFYHMRTQGVPKNAAVLCNVHDYLAMLLAGLHRPLTQASDAAGLGLFDLQAGCFDREALHRAGINPALLPALAPQPCLGSYLGKYPVYVAIGDNQASFLGATNAQPNAMLVNVGTGSQFSVYTPHLMHCEGLETRPFPGGGYLLVGASLCGGRAYALLEQFFREVVEAMTGQAPDSCYAAMDSLLSSEETPLPLPTVVPLFRGTRLDPTLRAEITGLSAENFTPAALTRAMLAGMTQELYEMYLRYLAAGGAPARLIGSGNGLRKNAHLQRCFAARFAQPLEMSSCREEAATGAALFAAQCASGSV